MGRVAAIGIAVAARAEHRRHPARASYYRRMIVAGDDAGGAVITSWPSSIS